MLIGAVPVLQGDYIKNLHIIQPLDILILLGLGAGVGNIGEAVSALWENVKIK